MATEVETVVYEKAGAVARLTLNRPRRLNAYNVAMRDELYTLLEAVRDDAEVRAVVLSGAGERAFCAGADLSEFGTAPSQAVARAVRWERDVWGLFLAIDKPIVAALHGYVIGSGVEMACLCDLRVASEDATFAMPETALGMAPAAGGSQTLPRVAGLGTALEMLLAGRRLSAEEARRAGLVHRVAPRDALAGEAQGLAESLAALEPAAVSAAKRAIRHGMDGPLGRGLEMEGRLAVTLTLALSRRGRGDWR